MLMTHLESGQIGGRLKLSLVKKQQSLALAKVRRAFDCVCGLGSVIDFVYALTCYRFILPLSHFITVIM